VSDEPKDPRLAEAYAHCDNLLREGDRDRWLACLFAPAAVRRHLHALYAFSLEVARIREIVSDPMPGEIRYQWWRDAIEGEARGDTSAHPVAAALLDTIATFNLPRAALTDLVDARTFDLYDDAMPGLRQLEGYCGETSSALIRLASLILAGGRDPGGADAAGHGGVAYALTGLLRALPWHAARGQVYLPTELLVRHGTSREELLAGRSSPGLLAVLAELRAVTRAHLKQAMAGLPSLAASVRPAFLPIALVEPYLQRMERSGYDPFQTPVDIALWWRQWILWRAARRWS
jgi:phytoene synthase